MFCLWSVRQPARPLVLRHSTSAAGGDCGPLQSFASRTTNARTYKSCVAEHGTKTSNSHAPKLLIRAYDSVRTMDDDFIAFCEDLWEKWKSGEKPSSVLHSFQDAAPEPYLVFDAGSKPLVVLTTNPGRAEEHQLRDVVRLGSGPLCSSMNYAAAAKALGAFYKAPQTRISATARRRIQAFLEISNWIGQRRGTRLANWLLQIEACPFHSQSLSKRRVLRAICVGGLLADYADQVSAFLREKPVLILSAAPTNRSLNKHAPFSDWVLHLCKLAGFERRAARFTKLVHKGRKVTCGAWVMCSGSHRKTLVLMMGGNHLPGSDGLKKLEGAICAVA
jgi:hypothetical protein